VHRFWYLRRLLLAAIALALGLSLLLAALVAWRTSHNAIALSAKRAVLNAERMIERTAADLAKLDALRLGDCNKASIEKLKRELRAQGIKMGLDDIGTGYSNLNQLQTMSYDFIKIDGLLVWSIQTPEGVSPVLESLIQLALKLKTEVVAKGVETVVQANALSKRGVNHLQGYLFGPAKPFKDILLTLEYEQTLGLRAVHL
jgi:sensor c-di-GMP phosphodiesterase-like protein